MKIRFTLGIAGLVATTMAQGAAVNLIASYQDLGAGPFSQDEGRAAWIQEYRPSGQSGTRSCAGCHGTDVTQPGRHVKTGKSIEPMALSVNPQRLSDPQKVEKWFRRNCRWTLGRECTSQEKGDFVQFIISQ